MTTTVTIKHEGPGHHDVLIEVINDANPGNVTRLKAGDTFSKVVYDTQSLTIKEAPERNKE